MPANPSQPDDEKEVYGGFRAWHSWLWPGHCLLCRARVPAGTELCRGCRGELPWINSACPQCATPLQVSTNDIPCGNCQQKPPAFDHSHAALHYAEPVDRLIVNLKYHRQLHVARTLGQLLAERVRQTTLRPDSLLPVPLHTSRLRQRGYNQSLEIARVISDVLGIPVAANLARRVRATSAQAELPLDRRAGNLRNAFSASGAVDGRHVAIVDDVMTSGHTVNALSKTLRRAGATKISVWVVARA